MGDERGTANESEKVEPLLASVASRESEDERAQALVVPRPAVQLPRPVTLPPRPGATGSAPPLRSPGTPPPPPVRSLLPLTHTSQPPPPPSLRASVALPPPRPASTRPPPPPASSLRPSAPPSGALGVRADGNRVQELLAELMSARKELTETGTELRRVKSERNALRVRLTHAENSARELASAFRTEAQLLREFVDTHAASNAALRARVSELEAALAAANSAPKTAEPASLRQIRGIGPAFERALLGLGISSVSRIAALSPEEIERIAPLIKARADRIFRDDWVGQAKQLLAALQPLEPSASPSE